MPGFAQVALYRQRDVIRRDGDAAARLLPGVVASAELFEVLGVTPVLGRGFRAGDDAPGAEPVAVLSFGLWQELGGKPSIIGTRLTLDGSPRTVIGVMPRGFWFPDPSVRIWTSAALRPTARNWNSTLVGRVAPGHDIAAMATPVAQLTAMLDERFDYPAQWDKIKDARITPLRADLIGAIRPALLATVGAMALILLIACANVAALMLGQVEARSVEFAVRVRARREPAAPGSSAGRRGAARSPLEPASSGRRWRGAASALMTRALPLGAWADSRLRTGASSRRRWHRRSPRPCSPSSCPTVALYRGDLRGVLGRARTGGIEGRGGRLENGLVVAEVALAVDGRDRRGAARPQRRQPLRGPSRVSAPRASPSSTSCSASGPAARSVWSRRSTS